MNRVLIIGAGPGGLAIAMLLARAGIKVRLFERLSQVGGRTSPLEAEGFRFDRGPTFFLYPRVLQEVYRSVGRDLDEEVPMVRLDPQYRLIFEQGGSLEATPDVATMRKEIDRIAPRDAPAFERFMDENRRKLARFRPCLESPFLSWRDVASPRMMGLLPYLRPWQSLDGYLGRFFRDERLRLAFSFQAKYLGMSPFNCPSLFSILSFLEYEHGVYHPLGGCAAVSENMARVAEELGVEIHLAEGVEELVFEGRRAVGVRAGGREHRADAVVIGADFARAAHQLIPNKLRRRWTDERLARKRFSCSTFMMYLGVEGRYDNLSHHNIFIPNGYRHHLDEVERQHVLSREPSFYVQNACVTDDSLAPPGMSTLYVLVPVTNQSGGGNDGNGSASGGRSASIDGATAPIDWEKEAPHYREHVLDRLERIGLTGLRERIRYEQLFTPLDWQEGMRIYRGATFNLAHNLGQMLHLRPHNRFEDVEGVYLVGGGTHPGSGLPVIFESSRITAKLLLEDFGMDASFLHLIGQ